MKSVKNRFGKPFGGDLILEAAYSVGKEEALHPQLKSLEDILPKDIVRLVGRIDKESVKTSFVVGLAAKSGYLYAITTEKVYRLTGSFYPEIIKDNPSLNAMWEDLKTRVMLHT